MVILSFFIFCQTCWWIAFRIEECQLVSSIYKGELGLLLEVGEGAVLLRESKNCENSDCMESSSCITNTLSPVADLALTPMSSNASNNVCIKRRVQHRGTRIVFLATEVVIFAKKQRGGWKLNPSQPSKGIYVFTDLTPCLTSWQGIFLRSLTSPSNQSKISLEAKVSRGPRPMSGHETCE